jgi:hypothetical protein
LGVIVPTYQRIIFRIEHRIVELNDFISIFIQGLFEVKINGIAGRKWFYILGLIGQDELLDNLDSTINFLQNGLRIAQVHIGRGSIGIERVGLIKKHILLVLRAIISIQQDDIAIIGDI